MNSKRIKARRAGICISGTWALFPAMGVLAPAKEDGASNLLAWVAAEPFLLSILGFHFGGLSVGHRA